MESDSEFQSWHKLHQSLEKRDVSSLFFKEKEVWFCSIGKNIGSEQNGKHEIFERPVLIFKKFNNSLFLGLPMTSKEKDDIYHFKLRDTESPSYLVLSQIRLLDKKRLNRRLRIIPDDEYFEVFCVFNKLLRVGLPNNGIRTFLCGFLGALRRCISILANR